ncbi:hypothetical protein [Geobacter argillaceus]|uniref:Lipoprotein n=1 Tax=Geobacter argillaceus TaxID=345631 RepID=A0A562VP93_9BACT|nr:hypothetical protein [Geobacter argillaceus]TWJ19753.1 hypothetical protein JN12_01554 [Geobacter argillaceus]
MSRVILLVLGISMFLLPVFMSACATVPQARITVLAKTGDTVNLFHGGSKVAKEEFCLNEVVSVYRYTGLRRYRSYKEVGKVKITGYVGDHYLEGVVVEGNVRGDDFAMKENSACLIRMPEPEEK